MPDKVYYLTTEEIQHYQYMLDRGYGYKIVDTGSQEYVVFAVADKPEIGVAWPAINGKIKAVPKSADIVLDFYKPLHQLLIEHLKGSTIQTLLAPRYVD